MSIWRCLRGRRRTSRFGGMDGSQVDRLVEKEQKREWCQKYERRSRMKHTLTIESRKINEDTGWYMTCTECGAFSLFLHEGEKTYSRLVELDFLLGNCPGPPKEKPGLPDEGPLWESRGDTITLSCAHSIYRFLVDIRDYLAAREKS